MISGEIGGFGGGVGLAADGVDIVDILGVQHPGAVEFAGLVAGVGNSFFFTSDRQKSHSRNNQ